MLVIIPAHNEERNIEELIKRTKLVVPRAQIVVVDDFSTDTTPACALAAGAEVIWNPRGSEYGDGFISGLKYAYAIKHRVSPDEPVVFMDAGLSHQPEDILTLVYELNGSDVVIGSRIVKGANYYQSWYRKLITLLGVKLLSFVLHSKPIDYSGFRAFSKSALDVVYRELCSTPRKVSRVKSRRAHSFNLELLAFMKRSSLKIRQVPITYIGTNSTLNPCRFLEAVWTLIRVRRYGKV
jgi:glycosyltransferase involved in cell wall biosynthesis